VSLQKLAFFDVSCQNLAAIIIGPRLSPIFANDHHHEYLKAWLEAWLTLII
jgi:hypothetical protein